MGVALFIVPERDVEGFDVFVNGKALGRCERLDQLAELAGVRSLMEFFSQDPDELEAIAEAEGEETLPDPLPAEQWFPAEDGLLSVRGMLACLEANPKVIPDGPAIIEDLKEFESVLGNLVSEGIRWHLAVDV
jgi:hypothetical protein